MSQYRVAKRYAKSLLDLSIEQKNVDAIAKDMAFVDLVCRENRDLRQLLSNPIINHDKKLTVLKRVFEGKVNEVVIRFFEIMSRKNREEVLYETADAFKELYNEHKGIAIAELTTAVPVDSKLKEQFVSFAADKTGKKVELKEQINEELIGGYSLKIGDLLMDASVSSKLNAIKRELAK